MKDELNIYYNEEADLLELIICKTTPAYYEEIKDGVFERIDEKTGKIKGFSVFSLKKRMKNGNINVPLPVKVQLSSS